MIIGGGENTAANGDKRRTRDSLSDSTGEMSQLTASDERPRRLAILKASIDAGTYHVSSARLADCLVRHMLQAS